MRKQDAKTISALTLAACLSMSSLAMAQMPGAPGAPGGPGASGPIDITADEQEFSGDAVIARGRVRVVYKDSVIVAPLATLYKDPSGNPNRAIFTGHPRLTQEKNKIDANTLIFEMAQQKIVAEGNAHSEVDVPEDDNSADTGLGGNTKTASGNKQFPAAPVNTSANKNNGDDDDDDAPKASANKGTEPAAEAEKKTAKAEKIITDSDRQEYDEATGKFDALGHVKVVHGEITVIADKLQLVYGAVNKKPETALFTGHVQATQGKNTTCADNLNYSLSTKRLQASGNVKSKVIQDKNQNQKDTKKKKNDDAEDPTAKADFFGAPAKASSNKQLNGGTSAVSIASGSAMEDNKPVWVFSDSQDYSKENGRVSAHGNVRVVSGDMYGCGPAIVLTKKPDGRADKVYFQGRSQISQPGRRWIADEITYIIDEKKVIANGNAKAMILQDKNQKQAPAQNYQLAGKKAPLVSENRNGASTTDKQRISSKEAITK